ncbi:MAG: hypothetical protein HYV09_08875, partial [Deltaproteobacteria bacterium]|nr:hypothetical protein [Deltaproteobacteria bacterium]
VFGEALWDLVPARRGETLRARRLERRCLGGAPANVAVTLARLGLDVSIVTAVGADALGEALRDELSGAGVDVAAVVSLPARTGVTFVDVIDVNDVVGAGVAPRFLPYRAPSADMLLAPEAIERLDMAATRWLHLGSSSFARAPVAYRHAWPKDALVADALADVIAGAAVLKASEADLEALGLDARALHARRPEGITVVTRAERGAWARWGSLELDVPAARARRVVDPTGAGDAFMAGLLAVLVRDPAGDRGAVLRAAIELGSRLVARAVSAIGATTALVDLARERERLARGLSLR